MWTSVWDDLKQRRALRVYRVLKTLLRFTIALALSLAGLQAADWPQDAGNAQRTGWTAEEPELPWEFAWVWNTPEAPGGHRYHQPAPHEPWEARVVVGGGKVFAPAGELGLFALRVPDGSVAWQFHETCHAAAAFHAESDVLFVGTTGGAVVKLRAADGAELGRFEAGEAVTKSLLFARGRVLALTKSGVLHSIEPGTMKAAWTYESGSVAATPPAWSERARCVVFCTEDLSVHCVDGETGRLRWKVKPSPLSPRESGGHTVEFTGGWPVVAERSGIVFVRLAHSSIEHVLWSGGGPKGKWPETNELIRARLEQRPELQDLFALRLADGAPAFVPAVGPAGVEDMRGGKPRLRVGAMPVVRERGGREFAYIPWRHGDTRETKWDGRWDSHLGEMTLETIDGLAAGDLRFVQFSEHGGWMHITDESCPLTMAGETIFHAHWDVSSAARMVDRSPLLGLTRAAPIRTEKRPPVARHLRSEKPVAPSHWHPGGLNLVDGRYLSGPGWWVYAGTLDIPTPTRNAYSEGILPRYTFAAAGHVFVQGNGGDLFVLRHAGK